MTECMHNMSKYILLPRDSQLIFTNKDGTILDSMGYFLTGIKGGYIHISYDLAIIEVPSIHYF